MGKRPSISRATRPFITSTSPMFLNVTRCKPRAARKPAEPRIKRVLYVLFMIKSTKVATRHVRTRFYSILACPGTAGSYDKIKKISNRVSDTYKRCCCCPIDFSIATTLDYLVNLFPKTAYTITFE